MQYANQLDYVAYNLGTTKLERPRGHPANRPRQAESAKAQPADGPVPMELGTAEGRQGNDRQQKGSQQQKLSCKER